MDRRSPRGSLVAREEQPADLSERHDEVDGDAEIEGDCEAREHESDEDGDHVADDDRQQLALAPAFARSRFRRVEMLAPAVLGECKSEDADGEQCQSVHRYVHTLAMQTLQRLGDKSRWEG